MMAKDRDYSESSTDSRKFDRDDLEEESESASDVESDESEDEVSDVRTSADDDDDSEEEEDEEEEEEEDSEEEDESDSGPDLARGKGNIETSSEDEDDWGDLSPEEPTFEHAWRELDKDAPRADEVTITAGSSGRILYTEQLWVAPLVALT